jgi:hypothetical protein
MTSTRKRHDGIMQRGRGYQISVGTYREMFRGTKTDARSAAPRSSTRWRRGRSRETTASRSRP